MSDPDTRETLDPAWEKLARERMELIWDINYATLYAYPLRKPAQERLAAWERTHAAEWNRLRPWYEVRLTPAMSPEEARAFSERMKDRFKEKQRP